MVADVISEWNI